MLNCAFLASTYEPLQSNLVKIRSKRPKSPIGPPSREQALLSLPHHPQIHLPCASNPACSVNVTHEVDINSVHQSPTRPAACNSTLAYRWRGEGMATDTWWYGQKHRSGRMGEAAWAPRLHSNQRIVSDEINRLGDDSRQPWLSRPPRIDTRARSCGSKGIPSVVTMIHMALLAISLLIRSSTAAFINFENCLSPNVINSSPKTLQFVPLYVWATFNSTADSHGINVTIYGNVSGIATQLPYPAPDDPRWANPNDTVGKIPDIGGPSNDPTYTTFTTQFNVLDYTPYNPPETRLCNSSAITQCPLAPVFNFTANE